MLKSWRNVLAFLCLTMALFGLAACGGAGGQPGAGPSGAANGQPGATPEGRIQIVEPSAGAPVKAGLVTVKVAIKDLKSDEAPHWHLWLNGTMAGMVDGLETQLALSAGEQVLGATITATGGHADNPDDPRAEVRVNVVP